MSTFETLSLSDEDQRLLKASNSEDSKLLADIGTVSAEDFEMLSIDSKKQFLDTLSQDTKSKMPDYALLLASLQSATVVAGAARDQAREALQNETQTAAQSVVMPAIAAPQETQATNTSTPVKATAPAQGVTTGVKRETRVFGSHAIGAARDDLYGYKRENEVDGDQYEENELVYYVRALTNGHISNGQAQRERVGATDNTNRHAIGKGYSATATAGELASRGHNYLMGPKNLKAIIANEEIKLKTDAINAEYSKKLFINDQQKALNALSTELNKTSSDQTKLTTLLDAYEVADRARQNALKSGTTRPTNRSIDELKNSDLIKEEADLGKRKTEVTARLTEIGENTSVPKTGQFKALDDLRLTLKESTDNPTDPAKKTAYETARTKIDIDHEIKINATKGLTKQLVEIDNKITALADEKIKLTNLETKITALESALTAYQTDPTDTTKKTAYEAAIKQVDAGEKALLATAPQRTAATPKTNREIQQALQAEVEKAKTEIDHAEKQKAAIVEKFTTEAKTIMENNNDNKDVKKIKLDAALINANAELTALGGKLGMELGQLDEAAVRKAMKGKGVSTGGIGTRIDQFEGSKAGRAMGVGIVGLLAFQLVTEDDSERRWNLVKDVGIGMIPVVGGIHDGYIAVTGKDLNGDELGGTDRAMRGVAAAANFAGAGLMASRLTSAERVTSGAQKIYRGTQVFTYGGLVLTLGTTGLGMWGASPENKPPQAAK